MSFSGKVALVSGASRGIGCAIAKKIGATGATVIGTATSESGAAAISNYLKEGNFAGCGMVLNVAEKNQRGLLHLIRFACTYGCRVHCHLRPRNYLES